MSVFFYSFLRLDTVRAAKTTLRVKFSYVMIALTIVGCITMVIRGKQVSTEFGLIRANKPSFELLSSSRNF